MTGAPSSTNPQAGGGGADYQTPREVPEAGGAPTTQTPESEQALDARCIVASRSSFAI
jgi:hypothetical protein